MNKRKYASGNQIDGVHRSRGSEIRRIYLAMKQASLYPKGHQMRTQANSELYDTFRSILSHQASYSLTAIENRLYIDQSPDSQTAVDPFAHCGIVSEEASVQIACELKQRGIRSVTFYHGIEQRELDRFLDIMNMAARDLMEQGGASGFLDFTNDSPHVKIMEIDYGDMHFAAIDNKDNPISPEEILLSYIASNGGEVPTSESYEYFLSLLEDLSLMARFVEKFAGYDGEHEPNSKSIAQCMRALLKLGKQFAGTDEKKKAIQEKLLYTIVHMDGAVKDAVFSVPDGETLLADILDGFSVPEVSSFLAAEAAVEGHAALMRKALDQLLAFDRSPSYNSPEELLAGTETAICSELSEMGWEDIPGNRVSTVLEEVFSDLAAGRTCNEQAEMEQLLDKLCPKKQIEQTENTKEGVALFDAENDIVNSAYVMLEMLEFEADYGYYSETIGELEEIVKLLVMHKPDSLNGYVSIVIRIVATISWHTDPESGRSPEIQKRAMEALSNMSTVEMVSWVLPEWLESKELDLKVLQIFAQQNDGKVTALLVESLLNTNIPHERLGLSKVLISMGSIAAKEIHRQILDYHQDETIKNAIMILREIEETEAVACLSDLLDHPEPETRRAALKALTKIDCPEAANLILRKVRDDREDKSIRQLAISILGDMDTDRFVEEFEKIMDEKNLPLGQEAVRVLGNIGNDKAITVLSDLLMRRISILFGRRTKNLQLYAVEVLSQIGTQSAMDAILHARQARRGKIRSECDRVIRLHDFRIRAKDLEKMTSLSVSSPSKRKESRQK